MTDYNLLAKAEIDKYSEIIFGKGIIDDDYVAIVLNASATAIQGIIDALNKRTITYSEWQDTSEIAHYTTLKQHIENYKP